MNPLDNIAQIKNLKEGDKIYLSAVGGVPSRLLDECNISFDDFSIVEITYVDDLGDEHEGWYKDSDKDMCWLSCEMQGLGCLTHTNGILDTGSTDRDYAQFKTLRYQGEWKVKNKADRKLWDKYMKMFPEHLI